MRLHRIKSLVKLFLFHKTTLLLLVSAFIKTNISPNPQSWNLILMDQLGYRPNDYKTAFVKKINPGLFLIKDSKTNQTVFKGNADSLGMKDPATGDEVYTLNFSRLTQPGKYYIELPAFSARSKSFHIKNDVYDKCALATLQSFYYQRCGIKIDNGTIWKHPACHTKPAEFYDDPSRVKDETGGWHDAGDYNKFVPTTSISAAFLLYAYDANPGFFYDGQLNIPENNNSVPDILDEARWGLNWLMKMQRSDGAVYQKVSIKKWTGEHLPNEETDLQYIFGISSSATADVAAVTALGARLFEKFDKSYSIALLNTAIKAWDFLAAHPENIPQGGFKNPPDVYGGSYNDPEDADERLWASIELYITTGSDKYINYFLSNYQKVGGPYVTVGYQNTANFAYYSFLLSNISNTGSNARSIILSRIEEYANNILSKIQSSGYGCALSPQEYYWGSNSVDLGYAFDLINAYRITKEEKYLNGALDQLHYILGRNTFGISFVTGVGYNPVRYPYHQFSMLKYPGDPVPGMVVGGPNRFSRLDGQVISNYPGKCYEDYQKNYFTNEPAINYTAPLVFVSSFFSVKSSSQEISSTKNN